MGVVSDAMAILATLESRINIVVARLALSAMSLCLVLGCVLLCSLVSVSGLGQLLLRGGGRVASVGY